MLDERRLMLLAEMGIDVYLPRAAAAPARSAAAPATLPQALAAARGDLPAPRATTGASVLLLAERSSRGSERLLADIARTFVFARVESAFADAAEETALATASALVVFGDAQARAVGALLPAQRQRELGWIVTGAPALLVGDAQAKRALWSELKRVLRALARG